METQNSQSNIYIPESPTKQGGSFPLRNAKIVSNKKRFSVDEYREITGDYISTAEKVQEKIDYLYAFCRNIIKVELEKHVNQRKNTN